MDTNEHELLCTGFLIVWDPLRGDPAFQKLCEERQP